ncbi:MAG: NADH:ubiquinone reductase (Na(+)-transporting) subunit C [Candidatus Delongbacteria bacterium]|nr:NADH:ubiquinone reductase (Na(+)-transporting) subunit C [Candidatus Delongbacteria bacterium]MBN2833527.1 NADH:ubiquinone reductase (Na(+)-transporting) subunit C [Candidatus Delongbacteria bacterium]
MLNKENNLYTLGFAGLITICCAILLSYASFSLKDKQAKNLEIEAKKNVLKAVALVKEDQKISGEEIIDLYEKSIEEKYVDKNGNFTDDGNQIFIAKQNGEITSYCIPVVGKGLWSTIYGYLALEKDVNTVKGITFYKHGETPGLGGEIEASWFTSNFVGKKIYDANDKLVSISVVKGQVDNSLASANNQVDGISGATLTCKGVDKFLHEDVKSYEPFFNNIRGGK